MRADFVAALCTLCDTCLVSLSKGRIRRMRQLLTRAAVLVALLPALGVHAETYRCRSGSRAGYSVRPCAPPNYAKLGGYGPLGATPTSPYAIRVAPVAKAEDHVKYLGSGCASISEAIRTGPNRGVRMDVIQGLREEYRQKCAIEDQDARSRARQDATAEQATKLAQRDVAQSQQQQAKAKADQCAGMRDVIATKRLRERDLNATEVAALRSLESSYNERCVAR